MAFSLLKLFNKKSPNEQTAQPRRAIGYSGGSLVTEDTSMKVAAFYRGVVYISTQVAKLPWYVKDSKNTILESPMSYLLDVQPNPEMSSFTFRLLMLQQAIIHGNAYAEIERSATGTPVAIWPIPTKNVELVRDSNGNLYYKVLSSSITGDDVFLRPQDVFHVRNFHTKDGLLGQGVVSYAIDSLGISLGADRMAGNLFTNGGLPSGILKTTGVLSDEAFERIKKSWTEAHAGKKTGGVAVLEDGVTYEAISIDPDVMQFLESRKFGVLEIARFLGLPPTKLFDTDASTYNNQENSNLEVATDTLDSWCRNLETEADIKILNRRYAGKKSELDLYRVFRGDMETRAKYFQTMMQIAALTPNEIRKSEGLPGYENGDRFYVSVNNQAPADRVDEVIDSQITSSQPKEVKDTQDPAEEKLQAAAIKFLERR